MVSPVVFSSKSDRYSTPFDFFEKMERRYGPFDLDVCAVAENAKCERFYSPQVDGLRQPWTGRIWCNPPYGRTIGLWIRKAWEATQAGATVVCLVPARTDTRWWHDYVQPYGEVEFVRGRLHFDDGKHPAPFPSVVVVFKPVQQYRCQWCEQTYRPARSDAKFCSPACKQGAYRARKAIAGVTGRAGTDTGDDVTECITCTPAVATATVAGGAIGCRGRRAGPLGRREPVADGAGSVI
jgi:phage N-6-adenine-methyltransferase